MDRRSVLAASAALLGSLGIGYALFAPVDEEERIREVLHRLAREVSFAEPIPNPIFFGSRLAETFQELFTESIDIRVPEVGGRIPSHRGQLGMAAAQVLSRYGSLDVTLGAMDIQVMGDTARVRASATVTASSAGLRRDTRDVDFDLAKVDGDWRVASVRVSRAE